MIYKFSDYAHDSAEDAETVEELIETYGWKEEDAWAYTKRHRPMYEVKAQFAYDTITEDLQVLGAVIDGVELVPK